MSKNEIVKKFPLTIARKIYKNNDDFYNKYSAKEIVELYTAQAKTCYDAIDMFLVCEITDGNDYIIEGYQVEPKLVIKLQKQYGKQNIRGIFLGRNDVENLVGDFKKSTTPNDWILAKTKDAKTYSKIAEMIVKYGKYFEFQAIKFGFKVFKINDDFESKLNEIENYLK